MRHRALAGYALSLLAVAVATLASTCGGAQQGAVTPSTLGCEATAGTAIAGQPTPYTCADTGFRPDPHGFSFANWGGVTAGDAITTETLVALFGAENVCVEGEQHPCVPRPAAIQWAAQMNELLASGRCEGMSVEAERFFAGLAKLKSLDRSAHTAADLESDNRSLIEQIDYWWATQLMPEVAAAASASRVLQPSAIVAAVTTGLRDGSANTMGIYSANGAHALTPFAVTFDEPYFSIWVYDSNHPGRPGRVLVDPGAETWSYQSQPGPDASADGGWSGSGPGGLEYTPMSARMRDFTTPFSDDAEENAFSLAVVATSADSSTEMDLRITGPGIDVDTATGDPAPEGMIVQQIDDDGRGHATLVYVRPSLALAITPVTSERGVPVTISLDGPELPWQEITLTTPAPGALPVRIEVSPDTGTRVVVTGPTTVTVSYDAGGTRLIATTVAGPGDMRVPTEAAIGR